ncbi:MAG: KH domain-containing protein [Flavonifractor plautii]
MGQKVNPHGLRVGVIKDWDSRWFARNEKVGDLLVEDKKIRDYLKKTLYSAGIPKIEIERDNAKVRIYLHCARPGVVIGKGGADRAPAPDPREDDRQARGPEDRRGAQHRHERPAGG